MNINFKQSQFELFPTAATHAGHTVKPQFLFSSLTLSLENVVIAGIFMLMIMIFAFSLGVERGRKIVLVNSGIPTPNGTITSSQKDIFTAQPLAPQNTHTSNTATPRPLLEKKKVEEAIEDPAQNDFPSGVYTIQVASFKKNEYAQKEAGMLRKKGYEIFVVSKGKYSIVCVGKFSEKNEAKVSLNRLIKTYKDSIVRRL